MTDEQGRWQLSMVEKLVGTSMLGLLAWMAVSVQQVSVDVAVLKSQAELGNRDRFTRQEGQALKDQVERLEKRLMMIEGGKDQ